MVALHLLRHADAGDPADWVGDDDLRPLSAKGRRQAERLGRHLAAVDYRLDVLISSPRVRAVQSAAVVAEALGLRVILDARLAEPLGPSQVAAILRDARDPARPALVGHDPDFSALLALLGGVGGGMPKGALARLDVQPPFEPGTATLAFLLPPRLLPR